MNVIDSTSIVHGKPSPLRRFNVAAVLTRLPVARSLSRAERARKTRIRFPTVVQIGDALQEKYLIEVCGKRQQGTGRPGVELRMASSRYQVIAVSVGPEHVRLALAGLDGGVAFKLMPFTLVSLSAFAAVC